MDTEDLRPAKRPRIHVFPACAAGSMMSDDASAPGTSMEVESASGCTSLLNLSFETLKLILRHVSCSKLQPRATQELLREAIHVRYVCRLLRDAFDAHVTSLDLRDLPASVVALALTTAMPRFISLSSLQVSTVATDPLLEPAWRSFFSRSGHIQLRELTYSGGDSLSTVPESLARWCAASLEVVSSTSFALVSALAMHCPGIRTADVMMDEMDPRVFSSFKSLQVLRVLYRHGITVRQVELLIRALAECAHTLQYIEMRVHNKTMCALALLAHIPRLRKVSLFNVRHSEKDGDSFAGAISSCMFLDALQLMWIDSLHDEHIEALSRQMGSRLRHLTIWNCGALTDRALISVAQHCPLVELELKFERNQFQASTLTLFGNRISWGSWGS